MNEYKTKAQGLKKAMVHPKLDEVPHKACVSKETSRSSADFICITWLEPYALFILEV